MAVSLMGYLLWPGQSYRRLNAPLFLGVQIWTLLLTGPALTFIITVMTTPSNTTEAVRAYFRQRQAEWRKGDDGEGRCNQCKNPPRPGKLRCQDCEDKNARKQRDRREAKKNPPARTGVDG